MTPESPPSIRFTHVSKTYLPGRPDEVRALRDVNVSLSPSEFLSVEGPSGCGKTTLLNLLGLIDQPTEGTIEWGPENVSRLPERERSRRRLTRIGFIFQRFYLLPTLTARENIELPLRAQGRSSAARRGRSKDLLEWVGLTSRADAFPHQLSGGEEQRVAIARALANEPSLILADEPTGELDSQNTDAILDLLVRSRDAVGATTILVTHNPRVGAHASRHLTMEDGRLVRDFGAS